MHLSEKAKMALDGLSVTAVIGTLAAWLPPLAAFLSIVWTLIRIYETKTVQGWLRRFRG